MNSIFERLDSWVEKQPDKLLFAFLDIAGNVTEKYTYSEFIYRTNAIASHLHNEYHFPVGSRILLAYPPGLEMICAFFACALFTKTSESKLQKKPVKDCIFLFPGFFIWLITHLMLFDDLSPSVFVQVIRWLVVLMQVLS